VLIDYFAGNDPVAALLEPPLRDPAVPVVVSTIALAELVTRPARNRDLALLNAIYASLLALPGLRVVDFDQDHAIETAHVRGETNLHLPDAAIVATARRAGASALLGNDRKWRTRRLGVPYHLIADILALP
jgi:predicted nucleic acid-binding protein